MAHDAAKKFLRSRGSPKITLNEDSGRESFVVVTAAGPGRGKYLVICTSAGQLS